MTCLPVLRPDEDTTMQKQTHLIVPLWEKCLADFPPFPNAIFFKALQPCEAPLRLLEAFPDSDCKVSWLDNYPDGSFWAVIIYIQAGSCCKCRASKEMQQLA